MRLVMRCPACDGIEDHVCQNELVEGDLWLVDSHAIAAGRRPDDSAPSHGAYRILIVSNASGLRRPATVLEINPKLVVGETGKRMSREPLFLGFVVREDAESTAWLYVFTGLHGLLCLVQGMPLRRMILEQCGAVLPVTVRRESTTVEPAATAKAAEAMLPPDEPLAGRELEALRVFVDARIESIS